MPTLRVNEHLSFDLPNNYIHSKNTNGKDVIYNGMTTDENGETKYKFSCFIMEEELNAEAIVDLTEEELLATYAEEQDFDPRYYITPESPAGLIMAAPQPFQLFVDRVKNYSLILSLFTPNCTMLNIFTNASLVESDLTGFISDCNSMIEIYNSIIYDGKPLRGGEITPELIETIIRESFEEEEEDSISEMISNLAANLAANITFDISDLSFDDED